MAVTDLWGYRSGRREIRSVLIANTAAAIAKGDFLKEDAAGTQYMTKAGAGDIPRCVALEAVALADIPSADGGLSILAEHSEDALFEYPADTGTVTNALVNKTMDLGGAQSIDIDATVDDVFTCLAVNTDKNSVLGRVNFSLSRTGAS